MLKITLGFSAGRYSWTESHVWFGSSSPVFTSIPPIIQTLIQMRASILGDGATLTRVRLSTIPASRLVADWLNGESFAGNSPYSNFTEQQLLTSGLNAAPAGFALSVLMGGAQGQETRIFLAGMPAGIFAVDSPNGLGWDFTFLQGPWTNLVTYLNFLATTGQFGWLSDAGPPANQAIWPLVSNAAYPGLVGVSTTAQFPMGNPPLPIQVKVFNFRRLSTRSPGLTGVYWVRPPALVSGTAPNLIYTYFLENTQLVVPTNFLMKSPPKIGLYTATGVQYTGSAIDYATTRKRGNSFGRPRGKSSIRA